MELDADLRARIRRAKDESVRACLRLRDPVAPVVSSARRPREGRCGYCGELECVEHADLDEALGAL